MSEDNFMRRVPAYKCLACKTTLNGIASMAPGVTPEIESRTVCGWCGAVLVFTCVDPYCFRLATQEEIREMEGTAQGQRAKRLSQEFMKRHRRYFGGNA